MIYSNFLIESNSIQTSNPLLSSIKFKLICFEIKIERKYSTILWYVGVNVKLNENSFIKMSNRIFLTIQFYSYYAARRQFRIKIPLSLRCSMGYFFLLFFSLSFFFQHLRGSSSVYYQMTSNIGVHKNLTRTSANINTSVLVLNDRDDYCRGERASLKIP